MSNNGNTHPGAAGMTMELIERLRKREQERPKMIEHVRVD
jgi:hypothetical protein